MIYIIVGGLQVRGFSCNPFFVLNVTMECGLEVGYEMKRDKRNNLMIKINRVKTFEKILMIGLGLIMVQCATVPITGRKQLLIMPESEMVQMSLTSYNDFLKENKLSTDATGTKRVKEVGQRIANAVEEYLKSQGMESLIKDYQWEFNLVASEEVNACVCLVAKSWCMRVFYQFARMMTGYR